MNEPEYEEWTERKIAHSYIHPQYDEFVSYHDFAILHLNESIKFRERVRPVCLPQQIYNKTIESTRLQVLGWGLTEFHEKNTLLRSTDLQFHTPRYQIHSKFIYSFKLKKFKL